MGAASIGTLLWPARLAPGFACADAGAYAFRSGWRQLRAFRPKGDRCPKKADAMKKTCCLLLCALFLSVAPSARAGDGDGLGALEGFFAQLISLFAEIGMAYPPGGAPVSGATSGEAAGDVADTGPQFPPGGAAAAGDEPETGMAYPPGG